MDDKEIINLYFARNEEAIRETDIAYGNMVLGLSYRILQSHEDAEENQDDTYLQAWRTIPPVHPFSLRAFILKICRRKALDKLDRRKAKKRNAELVALTDEMENCIPDTRQEEEADAKELSRLLNQFLGTLSAEHRDILISRCFCMEPVPAIAKEYGYSETKVRSILFRTRKRLKKYLESEDIWI